MVNIGRLIDQYDGVRQNAIVLFSGTSVTRLVPRIGHAYRRLVRQLADTIHSTDPVRGRAVTSWVANLAGMSRNRQLHKRLYPRGGSMPLR